MEGQYLGPMPTIFLFVLLYNGERSRFSSITWFVFSFVLTRWQSTWSTSSFSVENEKGTGSLSPGCGMNFEKSSDFLSTLGFVPVFNRPRERPSARRDSESLMLGGSSRLPPGEDSSPIWIRPFKKVPVVTITAFAL